jgi:hypothetical protein
MPAIPPPTTITDPITLSGMGHSSMLKKLMLHQIYLPGDAIRHVDHRSGQRVRLIESDKSFLGGRLNRVAEQNATLQLIF